MLKISFTSRTFILFQRELNTSAVQLYCTRVLLFYLLSSHALYSTITINFNLVTRSIRSHEQRLRLPFFTYL
jgi:hypothetical protein